MNAYVHMDFYWNNRHASLSRLKSLLRPGITNGSHRTGTRQENDGP